MTKTRIVDAIPPEQWKRRRENYEPMFIYLPSGRCVGFVRATDEDDARTLVKEMVQKNKTIWWRDRGYVVRRQGQQQPNPKRRKRR